MRNKDDSSNSTIAVAPLFTGSFRQRFRLQNTIADRVSVYGFGFWTGEDVMLEFRPARANTGIVFVRTDLDGEPRIPALIRYREEKPRQTSLVCGEARVDMVEHVLAAIRALRIDNCEIRANHCEMPGFDGSSRPFYLALEGAGVIAQGAVRAVRLVTRSFRVGTEENRVNVMPSRNGQNVYRFTLIPNEGYPLEPQDYSLELSPESFRNDIMASRTFITKTEAEYLLNQGLCERVTPRDVIVLAENGPIDNEFRYADECARHKVLDMVGDFSLVDCDWIGTFESYRGGHSLNAECVRHLLENTLLLDESFVPQNSDLMHVKQELLDRAA